MNKIHISSVHVPIYWRKCSRGLEMNHFANQFVFSIVNSFTCVIRIDGTFITSCPLSSYKSELCYSFYFTDCWSKTNLHLLPKTFFMRLPAWNHCKSKLWFWDFLILCNAVSRAQSREDKVLPLSSLGILEKPLYINYHDISIL